MVSLPCPNLPPKLTSSLEILQQARIRKKEEFLKAFDPHIVEGSTLAYKGTSPDIQSKMRRVFEVWRSRQVLKGTIMDELERSLDGTIMLTA